MPFLPPNQQRQTLNRPNSLPKLHVTVFWLWTSVVIVIGLGGEGRGAQPTCSGLTLLRFEPINRAKNCTHSYTIGAEGKMAIFLVPKAPKPPYLNNSTTGLVKKVR